jgi:hypothetical protein
MHDYNATVSPISLWMPIRVLPTVLPMEEARNDYKHAFAATVVSLRAEKQISSQAALGTLVGVSDATVQRWEDPHQPHLPNAWELRRLAEALGVEAGDLLYPQPFTERERQLARRAARASGRERRRGCARRRLGGLDRPDQIAR